MKCFNSLISKCTLLFLFTISFKANKTIAQTLNENDYYEMAKKSSAFYILGNSDSMLIYSQQSLKLAQSLKKDSFILAAYKLLGNCSRLKSDYLSALDNYFKGIRLADNNKSWDLLVGIFNNNIGDNYNKLGYHAKALHYLKISEKILNDYKPEHSKYSAYVYSNLSETYLFLDSLDQAFYYLNLASQVNSKANDNYIRASILIQFAELYSKSIKDFDLADKYFKRAIAFSDSTKDFKHLATGKSKYSSFLLLQKKIDQAKSFAINSYRISKKYKYNENILENSKLLGEIYYLKGIKDSAYYYSKLQNMYRDTLFNSQVYNQLLTLTFSEQTRENEEKIKIEEVKRERHLNIQYLLIAYGIFAFVILYFIFSRTVYAKPKYIIFLGEIGLLISFEFINMYIHPFIEKFTNHSPLFMLTILAIIAAILIPLHHKLEKYVENNLVANNKKIKLKVIDELSSELRDLTQD